MTRKQSSNQFKFTQGMLPVGENIPTLLDSFRGEAWSVYQHLPYPSTQDEAWNRTSLHSLKMDALELANGTPSKIAQDAIPELDPLTERRKGGRATLSPGEILLELTPELSQQGVIFTDTHTAAKDHPELLEKILGKIVEPKDGKFAALTAAFAKDGLFVYIPRDLQMDQTLHSLFLSPGGGLAHFAHLMIYLEEGSSLTYIHETSSSPHPSAGIELASISPVQSLMGENVEIYVGKGANLKFIELQTLGKNVWSFGHKKARVDRDGKINWSLGAVGSHLMKHFVSIDLISQGAEGRVSGMFFANEKQHLSYNTQQNHLAPHTYSNLKCKGALSESGRSVWRGMIYVAPGAKHTDGYQTNRNLILSDNARATSIPGLEILNDEVRCSHGSTVGKVDPEQMFYLQARGVPRPEAERLIVHGFFDEILNNIPLVSVRERLTEAINSKLAQEHVDVPKFANPV